MLNSLRSHLLLSYLAIIITALVLIALALLVVSASQVARLLPSLRELSAVSLSTRRELNRLLEQGGDLVAVEQILRETAETHELRVVLVERSGNRVIFDSQPEASEWTGIGPEDIDQFPSTLLTNTTELALGRVRTSDRTRWLVSTQPLAARGAGRLVLFIARPESTILQFFRETFLRPLCQAGLVAFLLALLLAVLISRSVARPLQQMAAAAEAIADGDYEHQIPLRGPDEVKRVSESFNTMAARVAATQKAQRDLLANVSHDLKTPLTSIGGWSQAVLDGTATAPEQQQRAVQIIHDEAGRMQRMVAQLLDLARIESGELRLSREPVDLQQVLTHVHRNLTLRAQERQIDLTLDAQAVPAVPGDHDRLVQIFTNLADNALIHTPAGGRVHLSVQPYGDQAVEVLVQDTGSGIPAEDLGRIFERFYQVDKARARGSERPGSGLGLAIVKELVEAHGGRITARSQEGLGSAFTVRLPTSDRPPGETLTPRRA